MSQGEDNLSNTPEETPEGGSKLQHVKYLSGMYQDWFLDYASYVILERAVPYLNDGLKPVQRRILHAMRGMEDGRYTKVANIIGQTMMYHPHGDASIGDALVQIGQKDLLVDTQGNWGNILTGDSAAASRYIEARLTKFALDVVFNPKTTDWQLSYDGRNREPITLPVKFPLLLAQGVEGIAVGLASKILPHNFVELIDASIAYLRNKPFELYPDFPTGGMMDAAKYNDGLRGGNVRVRARIEKIDNRTLSITEVPYGRTTSSLIDSVVKASEKGKIKIKKIDDNTAANVEILVHLGPGVSSDQTIDALYAFTDCELSISPNSCVILDDKPIFIGVSEILKRATDNTVKLLTRELEIKKSELEEQWHFASLERIFIEERIYKDKEFEEAENMDAAIAHIDVRLDPWKPKLKREITRDDILRLMEIKMARILKFNSSKADELIKSIEDQIAQIVHHLENIITFSIDYYKRIKTKYGKGKERKTEIRSFENIEATKVVIANQKCYIDREEGFVGTSLKKDEFLFDCSDIDDLIIFRKDGTYYVTKVSEKAFIGKNIIHIAIFKKNDKRTIYNLVYRDGKAGNTYMKRFFVTGTTRDREYNMMLGTAGSRIFFFSANDNGEAEVLKVTLKPKPRLKKLIFDIDLTELAIKGRTSMGNLVSKNEVMKITLKEKGVSTLGGRKIYFDKDVLRLNAEGRGDYLGEFSGEDKILVITKNGEYELYSYDLSNHFDNDILVIEKFKVGKVMSVVYWDADLKYYYVKRFSLEPNSRGRNRFIGDNPKNKLVEVMWVTYPRLEVEYDESYRGKEIIEVSEFIGVKSYKAKGKRLSTFTVKNVQEIEPVVHDDTEKVEIEEPQVEEVEEQAPDVPDNQMSIDFGSQE